MVYDGYHGKTLSADRVRTVSGELNLQWFGAKGTANTADAAGNAAALAAAVAEGATEENRGIYIPRGYYYFPAGISFANNPVRLIGDPDQTFIRFTNAAAGAMLTLDGGVAPIVGAPMYGSLIQDLVFIGHAGMTRGVWMRNFHQSQLVRVQIEDCTEAAFFMETCTSNVLESCACTVNRRFFAIQPDIGLYMSQRPGDGTQTCQYNQIRNINLEGLQLSALGLGIDIHHGASNDFIGGSSEGNKRGVRLGVGAGANAEFNKFDTMVMVQNITDDVEFGAGAVGNVLADCYCQNDVTFQIDSKQNHLRGGLFGGAIVNNSAYAQVLDYPLLTIAAIAAFNDPLSPGAYWSNVDFAWHHRLPGLASYADNAAALAGGLVAGDVYRTATGVVMVVF